MPIGLELKAEVVDTAQPNTASGRFHPGLQVRQTSKRARSNNTTDALQSDRQFKGELEAKTPFNVGAQRTA